MRPGSVTTPASTTAATATGTTWPSSPREWCTTGTSSRARLGSGSGDVVALRVGRESPTCGGSEGGEGKSQARLGFGDVVASRLGRESRERAGTFLAPPALALRAAHSATPAGVPLQHALPGTDGVSASAPAPGD